MILSPFVGQTATTHDVCHGSSGTSPIRRRSMPPSDSLERFDGSMVELMLNHPMIRSSPPFARVSISIGRFIRVQGTGHITLGGRYCGFGLSRRVNPRSSRIDSLSFAPGTPPHLPTVTSPIFLRSPVMLLSMPASCA